MIQENRKAFIYAAVALLSWATVATVFKITLQYYTHFEMLVVASVTTLLALCIIMTLLKKWSILKQLTSKQWTYFALLAVLNPVAYYLVLFKAYALLPAQVAQPINYTWPIVLLVLLAVFAKQAIPKIKYIGMFFSFVGVALISCGTGNLSGINISTSGILLAFCSAFLWAIYWMVNRKNKNIDGIAALFLTFLFGSIYLCIAAVFIGVELVSPKGLMAAMYVGLFEIAVPFVFFAMALRKTTNPALINQLCYLSPFMSLFLIHIVLGETIYFTTYIGLALIVFGIVFNECIAKKIVKIKVDSI